MACDASHTQQREQAVATHTRRQGTTGKQRPPFTHVPVPQQDMSKTHKPASQPTGHCQCTPSPVECGLSGHRWAGAGAPPQGEQRRTPAHPALADVRKCACAASNPFQCSTLLQRCASRRPTHHRQCCPTNCVLTTPARYNAAPTRAPLPQSSQ